MNILVINSGSSSIKFKLFSFPEEKLILKGMVDRVGSADAYFTFSMDKKEEKNIVGAEDHHKAFSIVLGRIHQENLAIAAIGHRFVHGGKYSTAMLISPEVKDYLKTTFDLAPLHNPYHYEGIKSCEDLFPKIPQVAVFDTAYYAQLPEHVYLYGLPYKYYLKYGIRKYGFHGTSHNYICLETEKILGREMKDLRIISCHLGNGSSLTATRNCKAVETSMGFTPLEGLLMGTRSGDLDPAAVLYIMVKEELSPSQADSLLNRQSGIYGISGISNDMREILREMKEGNDRAKLAFKVYCHRIKKYIGAYYAILEGLDALVFTAGIGENAPLIREEVCRGLKHLGLVLDRKKNEKNQPGIISDPESKAKILVIPTNEELMIARLVEEKAG